jgi:hypothetical protein
MSRGRGNYGTLWNFVPAKRPDIACRRAQSLNTLSIFGINFWPGLHAKIHLFRLFKLPQLPLQRPGSTDWTDPAPGRLHRIIRKGAVE